MSLLRAQNILVSLDGFASGEGQSLDAAFGHAQAEFWEWFKPLMIWRGLPGSAFGVDEAILLGKGLPLWGGLGGLHQRFDVQVASVPLRRHTLLLHPPGRRPALTAVVRHAGST